MSPSLTLGRQSPTVPSALPVSSAKKATTASRQRSTGRATPFSPSLGSSVLLRRPEGPQGHKHEPSRSKRRG